MRRPRPFSTRLRPSRLLPLPSFCPLPTCITKPGQSRLDLPPLKSGTPKYESIATAILSQGNPMLGPPVFAAPVRHHGDARCTIRRGEPMRLSLWVILAALFVSALAGASGCATDSGSSAEPTSGPAAARTLEPTATPTPEPPVAPTPVPTTAPIVERTETLSPEPTEAPTPESRLQGPLLNQLQRPPQNRPRPLPQNRPRPLLQRLAVRSKRRSCQ